MAGGRVGSPLARPGRIARFLPCPGRIQAAGPYEGAAVSDATYGIDYQRMTRLPPRDSRPGIYAPPNA